MRTEKIPVNSLGEGFELALNETSHFAEAAGLSRKPALRLRLLAEETLGMLHAITDEYSAYFWLEQDDTNTIRLHLEAETEMDLLKKQELIDISTDKRNAADVGFMGKIRNIFENATYYVNMIGELQTASNAMPLMAGMPGFVDIEAAQIVNSYACLWTLSQYRSDLDSPQESEEEEPALADALEELEKSIVASIADDVRVDVRGNKVELVIEKKRS